MSVWSEADLIIPSTNMALSFNDFKSINHDWMHGDLGIVKW